MDKNHEIFDALKKMSTEPSPYLKSRVLAELTSRRRQRKSVLVWKVVAACSVAFSLAILIFSRVPVSSSYEAQVGRAFVVHIEVEPLRRYEIAVAEIDLPRGVEFYSKEFPQLGQLKSLRMAWSDKNRKFPIVLRSVESGKKSIKVLFFDRDHNLVTERTFNIDLKEAS